MEPTLSCLELRGTVKLPTILHDLSLHTTSGAIWGECEHSYGWSRVERVKHGQRNGCLSMRSHEKGRCGHREASRPVRSYVSLVRDPLTPSSTYYVSYEHLAPSPAWLWDTRASAPATRHEVLWASRR